MRLAIAMLVALAGLASFLLFDLVSCELNHQIISFGK